MKPSVPYQKQFHLLKHLSSSLPLANLQTIENAVEYDVKREFKVMLNREKKSIKL